MVRNRGTLKRIEKNTYGVCELTGRTNSKTRLEGNSVGAIHRSAQAQLDTGGRSAPTQARRLGSVDAVGVNETEEEGTSQRKNRKKKNNHGARNHHNRMHEARKEGKSPSRYTTTTQQKLKTEKLEIKKYNPVLRRHTLASRNQIRIYASKTRPDKPDKRGGRSAMAKRARHARAKN